MSKTKIVRVDPKQIREEYILEASKMLSLGGLVVVPTETVYGVAADMTSSKAIERLYEIKKRPKDKPFSIHIAKKDKVEDFALAVPLAAYKLMNKFWPGPLTLILKSIKGSTVGLRMPDNDITLKILSLTSNPVVIPSANISDKLPPIDFEEAIRDLDGLVDFAIDAGRARIGAESSIVDFSKDTPEFLRIGALKKEELEQTILKKRLLFVCTGNSCRSVMAEVLFKKILQEKNRADVEASSAGTIMLEGIAPSSGTKEVLRGEGIDVSNYLSQRITKELIRRSDLILAMERMHEDAVLRMVPEVSSRVYLLKEFAGINDGNLDISDPIGKPLDFYKKTFFSIKEAVERVSKII